ncbi:MAG: transcriptional regulator [Candidatus Hodarchaeota archaeon]
MLIVKMILPSLRVEVARSLIEAHGLKPINAAKKMDVTPAAVTQYLKGVRGRNFPDGIFERKEIKKDIDDFIDELVNGSQGYSGALGKLCRICKNIRQSGLICTECKKLSPALMSSDCSLCRS